MVESRSRTVERLVGIADSFYEKNVPEAHGQIADLQNELEGIGTDGLTLNILHTEAFAVEAKLDANLDQLLTEGTPSLDGYMPMAMQQSTVLENPLFSDIKAVVNPSSRAAIISWRTAVDSPTDNYVYYGPSSPRDRVTVEGPNSTFHAVTLTGLSRIGTIFTMSCLALSSLIIFVLDGRKIEGTPQRGIQHRSIV